MRTKYADEFLARCIPTSASPNGGTRCHSNNVPTTYITPWMHSNAEVKYFECEMCHNLQAMRYRHPPTRCEKNCGQQYRDQMDAILGGRDWDSLSRKELHACKQLLDKVGNHMQYIGSIDQYTTKIEELRILAMVFRLDGDDWSLPDARLQATAFGKNCFEVSLLPSSGPCFLQTTWDAYDFVSYQSPRKTFGIAYTKEAVWAWRQMPGVTSDSVYGPDDDSDDNDDDDGVCDCQPTDPSYFVPATGVNPTINSLSGPLLAIQHGGARCDVWTISCRNPEILHIKEILKKVAMKTNDCPIPRYQMIIDPNQFVRTRKSDQKKVWVPCEFDISRNGIARLVGGERAHWMSSGLIDQIATPVLTAAIPLLAKLTKPHLLLEDQTLQVVVKAQSITVPKKQEEDDSPEYVGLWHVDGELEAVAAVVLYYYEVDDALLGGDMEFIDRRPMDILGSGDTILNHKIISGDLKAALRPADKSSPTIPNCSVPISTGTLMVFSNYQFAHRVLRMVNTSQTHAASRKFVALFILDPAADRLVPAKSHLAHPYMFTRALTGSCPLLDGATGCLPVDAASLVLEYLGIVPSEKQRRLTRNAMLKSQVSRFLVSLFKKIFIT